MAAKPARLAGAWERGSALGLETEEHSQLQCCSGRPTRTGAAWGHTATQAAVGQRRARQKSAVPTGEGVRALKGGVEREDSHDCSTGEGSKKQCWQA